MRTTLLLLALLVTPPAAASGAESAVHGSKARLRAGAPAPKARSVAVKLQVDAATLHLRIGPTVPTTLHKPGWRATLVISVARARHGTVRARLTIVLGKKRRVVAHVVLGFEAARPGGTQAIRPGPRRRGP